MTDTKIMLDCTSCNAFEAWDHTGQAVECRECGKRHSTASLYLAYPDKQYNRTEDGTLLDVPP